MIKARPRYPTGLYGTIYIDNIQKAVVICLIIPTTFPCDAGSRVDNVRHTSGYFFMLDPPASKGNIVGMIRQMTTVFLNIIDVNSTIQVRRVLWSGFCHTGSLLQ
jgi:hypothetical protein